MLAPRKTDAGHDAIAATLACEIISGARRAGSRMPTVEEMFARFGVSRVLMREVMKTLTAKGLIVAKSKVGTLVLPSERWNWFDADFLAWRLRIGLDVAFFNQLTQMRLAVEPAAAALAAEQCNAVALQEMRGALAGMHAAVDRHAFAQADLRFHIALSTASGNPLFRSFSSVVEAALEASLSLTAPDDEIGLALTVARHVAICDAIEAGRPDAAAAAMRIAIGAGIDAAFLTR